jgi:integrase
MLYRIELNHPRNGLEKLVADTWAEMDRRGYLYHSMYEALRHWRHFAAYAADQGIEVFTAGLGAAYTKEQEDRWSDWVSRLKGMKRAMRILTEFHLHGRWDRHPRRAAPPPPLPPFLTQALERFLAYWEYDCHMSRSRLEYGRRYLRQWLSFLADKGHAGWEGVDGALFSAFFAMRTGMAPSSLSVVADVLRQFHRHLFVQGDMARDVSHLVPPFRGHRRLRLPRVWTEMEVTALLEAVDRASPVGKRAYAILLLGCRLGLRSSDIRSLRLDDLDWGGGLVSFTQEKTGRRVTLPLTEEVGSALIDYLRHGRPVSPHREVFLMVTAPYAPFSADDRLHRIVDHHRRLAGIPLEPERPRGMHSLRHTVATRLMEARVPLETIADVLGHASVETTRGYTRVDVNALRQVALEVKEAGDER